MKITFTPKAWHKQQYLLNSFDTEVGWFGLARRKNETDFEVYDIVVYPQIITGATVNTDQQQFDSWMMSQPPEIYQNIRYQAHSHVNFSPNPSSVDIANTRRNVANFCMPGCKNDWFLFLIFNKAYRFTARLYVDGQWYDESSGNLNVTYYEVDKEFMHDADTLVKIRTAQDDISFDTLNAYYSLDETEELANESE